MFATAFSPSTVDGNDILYADPVAMELLNGVDFSGGIGSLGAFVESDQLGFVAEGIMLAKSAPIVIDTIKRLFGGAPPESVTNPISTIVEALPAEAIHARQGADGYWYDLTDGHKLTHDEATRRKNDVVAAVIGATVGTDGWWYDASGRQLSHGDAWALYQRHLNPTGVSPVPIPFSPIYPTPGTPITRTGAAPKIAGMSGTTMLLVVGAAVALTLMSRKK